MSQLNHNIGLTIPGRPPTPCNGRIQHYSRPGDVRKQETKTYSNGSTLTFGKDDIVSKFSSGEPFYEQAQVVEAATVEIVAVRKKYQDGGHADIPAVNDMIHTNGQDGPENDVSSSIQNSFAALSIAVPPASIASRHGVSKRSNHLVTEPKPRDFAKGFQRGRHNRHGSNRGLKISNGNIHKNSNKARHPVPERPIPLKSYEVGRPSQQASNMGTQNDNISQNHAMRPGFHYNTVGAAISGLNPQNTSNMAAQGFAQSAIQVNQPGDSFNHQQASSMAVQGFVPSATHMNQTGHPLNIQHPSYMAPQGPVQFGSQMHQHWNNFNGQQAPNFAAQNLGPFMPQMSQAVVPFNPQSGAWSIADPHPIQLTAYGPPPSTVPVFHPGFSFGPQVGAQNAPLAHNPLMAARYATSPPDPNYYGPLTSMSALQKDLIMSANGIRLPAQYNPDFKIYNGPLHFVKAPAADDIIAATEAAQNPAFPFYRPRGNLAHMTMLQPVALPPQSYFPGMSQMNIHIAECIRHTELMQEVLAIPGDPKLKEEPMKWYRLLRDFKVRHAPLSWHPHVIDLYGRESQYEMLLVRDVNHRNSNEKGVGRRDAPVNRKTQTGTNAPTVTHARQESDDTSVFFREHSTPPPPRNNPEYIAYRLRVKRYEQLSPEVSPTPPSRGRSAQAKKAPLNFNKSHSATEGQKRRGPSAITPLKPTKTYSGTRQEEGEASASKTPLLDFDRHYTAMHGEGDDTDFAVRDMGPPRIGGKTFNEAIGFTPSPKKAMESSASLFYPQSAYRKHRD